jgi:hypothetical protein
MPLFPYLPLIVWIGVIQVVLGATHTHDVQSDTVDRGMIVPFRTPFAPAA